MRASARHPALGFSLLEATIALAILSVAAVVCLEVRAQGLVRARALQEARAVEDSLRALLDLAEAGLLPGGAEPSPDDASRRRVWRGVENGEAWECVREIIEAPNPAKAGMTAAAGARAPSTIRVERTTVSIRGRSATSLRAVRS